MNFSLLLTFMFGYTMGGYEKNYKFKIQIGPTDKKFYKPWPDIPDIVYDSHLWKLGKEDRDNLCRAAKEFAELDGSDVKASYSPSSLYLIEQRRYIFFVQCFTIPVSYLSGESDDDLTITIPKNEFIGDDCKEFEVQTLDSYPFSRLETLSLDPDNFDMTNNEFDKVVKATRELDKGKVTSSALNTLDDMQRFQLCLAAKKCALKKYPAAKNTPISFLTDKVEKPEVYKIDYKDRTEYRVALRCPTSPLMHVLYKNLRVDTNFLVLYVRGENAKRHK